MPWKECSVVDEKVKFVARLIEGEKMAPLCREFNIARKTGYQIWQRYKRFGQEAFVEQKRTPYRYANKLPVQLEMLILDLKKEFPDWGAPKLREKILRRHPEVKTPAISTIHAVLDRHGLVQSALRRRRYKAEGTVLTDVVEPNDLWCADYKGEFMLGDKRYCYPLTITDYASRFLLCAEALSSTREDFAFETFTRIFKEFGLPRSMRTDNGTPFASGKRNFLLTGVAYCHECGRPLVGSTGHGSGGEVQYYLHRPIEGKPVTCEVKRFRAEIAESAIENHFLRVVLREGYLDGLAQELEKSFKSLHKDKLAERIALEQKIVQADKDLTRLIKLQMQTDDDDLRELYSDQLKTMKDQRKVDIEAVEAMKEAEASVVDPAAFKNAIEFNMRSLQKAWDKSSPSLRKKLLRAVVDRLEFRPDGIDIHYYPVQANLLTVQSNQSSESTGAEPVDLASFRKSKEKQKADLAASHAGLSDNAKVFRWYIVGNGCGSRI